jgi:hypothetical protein
MRATINFEIDIDQVEETMAILIAQESDSLRAVADMIDVQPGPRTMVLEEVTEGIRLLAQAQSQLQQYQQMLVSFNQAKFETLLPQSVDPKVNNMAEAQHAMQKMGHFDNFLDRINKESENDSEPQEG